jgi:ATP-binding cassette subfamily B protein/subfamily B ATP-binding cassette protein MsbA
MAQAAWEQKYRLLLVFGFGLAAAILEGLTFALLAVALDLLASNSALDAHKLAPWGLGWLAELSSGRQFVVIIVAAVLCQVAKSVLQVANSQVTNFTAASVALSVQRQTLGTILGMRFDAASRFKVGELTNMVVVPAESVSGLVVYSLGWLTNFLTVFAYVVVLCGISPLLFCAAILLFGTVVWLQRLVGRNIAQLSHQLGTQQGELSRMMVEGIGALRLVHAFQRHAFFRRQVEALQTTFIDTMQSLNGRMALLGPMSESLMLLGLGAFLLAGFFLFRENRASLLPDLLTFIAVLNRLSAKITAATIGWSEMVKNFGKISIMNQLLEVARAEPPRPAGRAVGTISNEIRFENVSLCYPGRAEHAVAGVSISVPVGSTVALVGASGSGKSSMADLLLGLYEPTAGRITVDGVDLRDIDMNSWRDLLGVVSQDTILFNATVRENLMFAQPDATVSEIMAAIDAAGAREFVDRLPNGIETLLGERGFMLSGGQRQRLAIARALLRHPALLILDEATSALDTHAERAVQATLDTMPSGGTRLVIAHRLSTIQNADMIVVMDHGRVVECGTHAELLKRYGLYAGLWRRQSGNDPLQQVAGMTMAPMAGDHTQGANSVETP